MTNPNELQAGPELDAMVAVEVMGWMKARTPEWVHSGQEFHWEKDGECVATSDWHPSTDIAAAWGVHQQMHKHLFSVRQRYYLEIQNAVAYRHGTSFRPAWPDVFGLLKPEDICRAALAVVRMGKKWRARLKMA